MAITILTASDLNDVRNDLAGDYILGANIDLVSYANWEPIGTAVAPFTGKVDGSTYTISNLTIDRSTTDNVGLFGVCQFNVLLNAPNLKNINITGASVTGQDSVGVLAGKITTTQYTTNGFNLVESCTSTGTVTGRTSVGGLIGYAEGVEAGVDYGDEDYYRIGRIASCYSLAVVTGSGENIGGLVGYLKYLKAYQSHATGTVTGGDKVGGLIGYYYDCSCEFCYATGNVTGKKCVGGLVGYAASRPLIRKSYAEGSVTGTEAISEPEIWNTSLIGIGGLVGFMDFELIDRCYALGDVVGIYRAGGLVGAGNSGGYRSPNIANSFAQGNVSATGQVGGLIGYVFPYYLDFRNVYCTGSVTGSRRGAIIGYRGAPYFPNDPIGTITFENPVYYNSDTNTATNTNGGEGKTTNELGVETTYQEDWFSFGFYFVIDQDESPYPILKIFYDPLGIVISAIKGTAAQGLICAYTVDGIPYYRKFNGASWAAAVELADLPYGVDTLNTFRTNDDRIGFIADVDGAMTLALTEEDSMTIEYTKTLPPGTCGNLIQTAEDVPKLYYVNVVQSMSKSEAVFSGDWGEIAFSSVINMASDSYISRLRAKHFDGKTWIAWRSRGQHRIFPQNEAADEEEALKLVSGSISIRQDTPVVSVSLEVDSFDRTGEVVPETPEETIVIGYQEVTPISDTGNYTGYPVLINELTTVVHQSTIPSGYIGIYTAEDLNNVRNNLSDNYIQMADIDLSGYASWVPIGAFTGIYDGNNFNILNLKIVSGESQLGLFKTATGATFRNIRIISCNIQSTYIDVGALIGYCTSCNLDNCYSSGSVVTTSNNAGGLIGEIWTSTVTNCGSDCTVNVNTAGGGLFSSIHNSNISNCFARGDVTGKYIIGGIIGRIWGSNTITDVYAMGDVNNSTTTIAQAGGVVGYGGEPSSYSTITRAFATGRITNGLTSSNVGPIIGFLYSTTVVISDSYYDSQTTEQVAISGRGIGKTTIEMQQQATFVDWDFEAVWEMSAKAIYTVEDLIAVTENMAGNYIQMANLDLSGYSNWIPLTGDPNGLLEGVFDGNGYKITGFTGVGLFVGTHPTGIIKNVRVIDVNINKPDDDISVIVTQYHSGKIQNCFVSGRITGDDCRGISPGAYSGSEITNCTVDVTIRANESASGISSNYESTITNCIVSGDIFAGYNAGGICQYNNGKVENCVVLANVSAIGNVGGLIQGSFSDIPIKNCYVTGNVTSVESDAGGLIQYAGYDENQSLAGLEDCYATGDVTSSGENGVNVGGLVSFLEVPALRCYATGNVTAFKENYNSIGGFAGFIGGSDVSECYSLGNVTGQGAVGGFIGELWKSPEGKITDCYAKGNVSNDSIAGQTGGFVGIGDYEVENCYSAGKVNGQNTDTGGFVGWSVFLLPYPDGGGGIVTSCFYDSETSERSDTHGGEPKTTAEMKIQSTFVNWDFNLIWKLSSITGGYPALIWQLGNDECIPNYPPASKIKLNFKAGDSDPLLMGSFYVDRTSFTVGRANVSVDARNSVGKYLKDQTFDERNTYSKMQIQLLLAQILTNAGTTNYYIGEETTELGIEFSPNQDILNGINDVLTTVRDWMIREEPDGKVVVAERIDAAFTQPGTYTFYRNRDVFSRSVTKDDNSTYGRVCVHTSDFSVKAYRPVSSSLGWLPPAQKTLYQQCPDGTTSIQAAALATEIAEQLSNSGEVEEFIGPIRPQLMPGDGAQIIDEDGPNLLGTITTVTHRFGPDGFYTQFTVDSGGKINKPLLSDYLKQISAGAVKSKITS